MILMDCDDETRTRRLTQERGQPELANPRMMDWARFLRREAHEAGCEVLDTARVPLAGSNSGSTMSGPSFETGEIPGRARLTGRGAPPDRDAVMTIEEPW